MKSKIIARKLKLNEMKKMNINNKKRFLTEGKYLMMGNVAMAEGALAAGLDFLLARFEVDPKKIGAIGFSMGGATAIRAAARHPEIRAVIRDGGFSNLGAMLDGVGQSLSLPMRLFCKTAVKFYNFQTGIDPWSVSPLEDLSKVSPRPVLLIYGQYEGNYGLEQYEKEGDGKMLWIVPGGHHGQNHLVAADEYEQRILNFFEQAFDN